MALDPTRRFSSRVDGYARYRPKYPPAVLALLERECGLTPEAVVADIGSGTGIFSKLLLDFGCQVFGVEPNREMRQAGENFLAGYPRFHSTEGRAEETTLPDKSADFVTAGQAFHWFDQPRAREEFRRILRPPGWVALVWNERLTTGTFLEGYENLLLHYSPEYPKVDHRQVHNSTMDDFFGAGLWRKATITHAQKWDLDGTLGLLRSASYAPLPGTPEYDGITAELTKLFEQCHVAGKVAFEYETQLWWGRLLP